MFNLPISWAIVLGMANHAPWIIDDIRSLDGCYQNESENYLCMDIFRTIIPGNGILFVLRLFQIEPLLSEIKSEDQSPSCNKTVQTPHDTINS